MTSEPAYVEVPGQTGLLKTFDIPAERIQLPLIAPNALSMVFAFGFPACVLLVVPVAQIVSVASGRTDGGGVLGISFAMLFLIAGLLMAITAIALIMDRLCNRPALTIDLNGLTDRRLGLVVPWSSVTKASLEYAVVAGQHGGVLGVRLRLRHPLSTRFNSLRLDRLWYRWRHRPGEVRVSMTKLAGSPHVIGHSIIETAKRNDVEVDFASAS